MTQIDWVDLFIQRLITQPRKATKELLEFIQA
jgi:hypothetical protein